MQKLVGGSHLPQRVVFQMALATRVGGSGAKSACEVLDAACLGGWVAAHSSSISVWDLDPSWKAAQWNGGSWRAFADAQEAWRRVTGESDCLRHLAAAIQAVGSLAVGGNEIDANGGPEGVFWEISWRA